MGWKSIEKDVDFKQLRNYLNEELQMSAIDLQGISLAKNGLIVKTKKTVVKIRKNPKSSNMVQVKSYTPTTIMSFIFFPVYVWRRIKKGSETKYIISLIENYQ